MVLPDMSPKCHSVNPDKSVKDTSNVQSETPSVTIETQRSFLSDAQPYLFPLPSDENGSSGFFATTSPSRYQLTLTKLLDYIEEKSTTLQISPDEEKMLDLVLKSICDYASKPHHMIEPANNGSEARQHQSDTDTASLYADDLSPPQTEQIINNSFDNPRKHPMTIISPSCCYGSSQIEVPPCQLNLLYSKGLGTDGAERFDWNIRATRGRLLVNLAFNWAQVIPKIMTAAKYKQVEGWCWSERPPGGIHDLFIVCSSSVSPESWDYTFVLSCSLNAQGNGVSREKLLPGIAITHQFILYGGADNKKCVMETGW